MPDRWPSSEVAVGRALRPYLERDFNVRAELSIPGFKERPDFTCERHGYLKIVELRLGMSFDLLGQAEAWWLFANEVWAAVPLPADYDPLDRAFRAMERAFKADGVGLYFVAESGRVSPVIPATVNKRPSVVGIHDALGVPAPEREAGSPGNPNESRLAEFDAAFVAEVAKHTIKGASLPRAMRVAGVPASSSRGYAQRVRSGKVRDVWYDDRRDGRVWLASERSRAA